MKQNIDCDFCYPENHINCQSPGPYNGAAPMGSLKTGQHYRCSDHKEMNH